MENNWPWRRIVLTWALAIACGCLSAFARGDSRTVIRACFLFAFLTAFLPMANRLRRRGDSGWLLVLTAAMGWGCLGNACAFLWLDSFALRVYWPLYILAGGVYHVLLYGAYLLGHKYQLRKVPLFLLLLLAACLGYVFLSLPFISSVEILLGTILSSVNSVIVIPVYLLLLFTALNGDAWQARKKARRRSILEVLAVLSLVLGFGYATMIGAAMNNVLREREFMLQHHSSLEPLRGLQGRLRGKGADMIAYDLDEKGWVPAVIDFSGARSPEVNTKALKNDPPRDAVEKVATSPDGNYLAELSTAAKETNTALQINNAATGEQLFRGPLTDLGYMPFLAWSDDSKMLVLSDSDETNNIVVCLQDNGSFSQQHIDGRLLGFVPSRRDLLFIKDGSVFRQQPGALPEELLPVPWLNAIPGMDCRAMTTAPDGRFLIMLCNHSRFFYPSQTILVVTNLSDRTMYWLEVDTRNVAHYLAWEELPHEQ